MNIVLSFHKLATSESNLSETSNAYEMETWKTHVWAAAYSDYSDVFEDCVLEKICSVLNNIFISWWRSCDGDEEVQTPELVVSLFFNSEKRASDL